jgi:hypothetical protein
VSVTSQAERASHARANAAQVQLLREAFVAAQGEPESSSCPEVTGQVGSGVRVPPLEHVDPQADTP